MGIKATQRGYEVSPAPHSLPLERDLLCSETQNALPAKLVEGNLFMYAGIGGHCGVLGGGGFRV